LIMRTSQTRLLGFAALRLVPPRNIQMQASPS